MGLQTLSITAGLDYLSQVASHFNVVPGIVVEFAVNRLHNSLEGPRAQVDDEGNCTVFEREVDVVGRLPRVQEEAVALPRLEGERDLIAAALDGVLRQVITEVFGATEGGNVLLSCCNNKEQKETNVNIFTLWQWQQKCNKKRQPGCSR